MSNNFDIVVGVRLSDSKVNEDLKNIQNLVDKKDLKLNLKFNDSELIRQVNNIDRSFNSVNTTINNMNNGILNSVSSLARFTVASTLLYGTYKQLGEMVSYVNDQNSKIVNIAMVGDYSLSQVKGITKGYSELATQLHTTNKEVLDAAENFMRAGNNIDATKNLIKASAIGSAISGQTNEQTSEQLIAISNGFKMNTEDGIALMNVINQISTADNKSATSFAEISNAMKNCSNSAQTAKVDLTHLVAYLSVVESVTRKNASSIGESFKAQFARYENVRGGKNFDETGDLSNVERDLDKYAGIKIRSDVGTFKSYEETIDTLKAKWSSLNEVSRAAISKAMAGVTHAEDFQALMNNMDKVDKMLGDLGNSAGSAEKKFNELYSDSTKAHIADMKHAQEELFDSLMDSKKINVAIDGITKFINTLNVMTNTEKASSVELLTTSAAIVLLIKNFSKLSAEVELFNTISKGVGTVNTITGTMSAFGASIAKTGASLLAFVSNPVTLAIVGLGALTGVIISHINHQADLKKTTESLTTSYKDLTKAMAENNVESMKNDLKTLEQQQKKLDDLLKQKKELEEKLKNSSNSNTYDPGFNGVIDSVDTQKLQEINKAIEEQKKVMRDAGLAFDSTTGKVLMLSEAEKKLKEIAELNNITNETEKRVKEIDGTKELINEYEKLSNSEEDNTQKKTRLSELARALGDRNKDLKVATDEHGNAVISNTEQLGKSAEALEIERGQVIKNAQDTAKAAKDKMEAENAQTKVTIEETRKRIETYVTEMNAIQDKQAEVNKSSWWEQFKDNISGKLGERVTNAEDLKTKIQEAQNELDNLEKIQKQRQKTIDDYKIPTFSGSSGGSGYVPTSDDAKKSTDAYKTAIDQAKDATKDFDNTLKDLDNTIYALEANMSGMDDSSQTYRDNLSKEIELLQQKNNTLDKGIALAKSNANSLNATAGTSSTVNSAGVSLGNQIVQTAEKYLGTPYVWGGESPSGFDCSGLVQFIYDKVGVSLNRTSQTQFSQGTPVSKANLTPGDLVFFKGSDGSASAPGHVGIYAGNGEYIQSPKTGDVVKKSNLNGRSDYVGARRIVDGGTSSSGVNSKNYGLANEANSLESKIESYEKEKIDTAKKIQEIYNQIYEWQIKVYDSQNEHVDRNKDMAQTMYNIYKDNESLDGMTKASQFKEQIWKEINQHYGVLDAKEKYITSQLYNDNYDEKTKVQALKDLEQVRIDKQKTIQDLHSEFQSWQEEMYNASIKTNQTNIDTLQRKYDILDKSSIKNYTDKINLNNEILGQEQEIYQKTLDRIDAVQKLISNEKDDNTRQIWIDEQNKLLQQLDDIKSKTIEIQQKNIELAKDNALDDVEKAIYSGKTQTEYEDSINAKTQALDDQLEAMQKQNDALQEQETRQKNLLDLAEAQIKLQDAQNERNVQQLVKDKNGNWNFTYVANQENVDSLEKEMRDKVKSNSDWEESTSQKHLEESINNEKELLNEEVSLRQEAYSRIKENLEKAIQENKDAIIDGTITISSLIDTSLGGINTKYNGKYSSIIGDLKLFISNYTTDLTNFNNTLRSSLIDIDAVSASTTPGTGHTVWVTDTSENSPDYQTAKQFYNSLGYNIQQVLVDGNKKLLSNIVSGDILLGKAANDDSKYGVGSQVGSGVEKIIGADRHETASKAQSDAQAKLTKAQADAQAKADAQKANLQAQQATVITPNVTVTPTGSVNVSGMPVKPASSLPSGLIASTSTGSSSSSSSGSSSNSSTKIQVDDDTTTYTYSNGTHKVYDNATGTLVKAYAEGTTSAVGGLSLVGEEGAELRVLNQGDGIIPSEVTKNLLKLGTNPLEYLKDLIPSFNLDNLNLDISSMLTPSIKMPDISGFSKNTQQQQPIQNFNLDNVTLHCPNVIDGQSFIDALKQLPFGAMQYVHSNR